MRETVAPPEEAVIIDQIPADDWTDQDLLTRDEAGDRLTREIAATEAELAEPGLEDAARDLLTRRLDAMRTARDELTTS